MAFHVSEVNRSPFFRFSELHTSVNLLSCTPNNSDSEVSSNKKFTPLLYVMTTCHSLKLVNGELIGDPLDLKMFNFTNWILEESGQDIPRHSNGSSESTVSNSSTFAVGTSGIVPTIVRPPGSKQFDLSDVLNHVERNGEGKVISLDTFFLVYDL